MNFQQIVGREPTLFVDDVARHEAEITDAIRGSRVLLIGGAGSIGKEVAKQIFERNPAALHIVDLSENNLVALVRDLRSTLGYSGGETRFLPLDMAGVELESFVKDEKAYDYVLNLAAMKHVRSEKDAYSLMRMVKTNVLDTLLSYRFAVETGAKKFFAVSTDKAKNPANLMGATKRIMEQALFSQQGNTSVSTARFANVAFSDGSLLHGFQQRLMFQQPISAPRDVRRYFVTSEESGLLCLASLLLGARREIFFPNLDSSVSLLTFAELAVRFLAAHGYQVREVFSEEEARSRASQLIGKGEWPCYFFDSDTAGEKSFEEFYADDDNVIWSRFSDIGVIESPPIGETTALRIENLISAVSAMRARRSWSKSDLVATIAEACPELSHIDVERSLDEKM